MKPTFILLTAIISLILLFGLALSQNSTNNSSVTPADALKAYGNSNIEPMALMGKSFAVFQSPAFKKDRIKGLRSVQTNIDENVSRNELPGQTASLKDFALWYVVQMPETYESSGYSDAKGIPTFDANATKNATRINWTPPANPDEIPLGPGNEKAK